MSQVAHLDAPALVARLREWEKHIRFDHDSHTYEVFVGGRWVLVPSVSEIRKGYAGDSLDALMGWAANKQSEADLDAVLAWLEGEWRGPVKDALAKVKHAWKRKRKEAADLGTETHALVEQYLKRMVGVELPDPDVSDDALTVFDGWRKWAEQAGLEPVAIEQRVAHIPLMYAGTLDLLAYVQGRLTVLDWKTRGRDKPDVWESERLQSFAYRAALVSMGLPQAEGLVVVLPRRLGTFQPTAVPIVDKDGKGAAAFCGLRATHEWLRTLKAPRRGRKSA